MHQLLIIFILFFTSSFAEFHQMKYEIDFQLQCSHLPQGTIKNYTMNNRVYQCSIPNRKNKVKQNNEEQWENAKVSIVVIPVFIVTVVIVIIIIAIVVIIAIIAIIITIY